MTHKGIVKGGPSGRPAAAAAQRRPLTRPASVAAATTGIATPAGRAWKTTRRAQLI
jgi:hypothetical protein